MQENLSATSGLRSNCIGNVERGSVNITLASLETLANGVGCSIASLLQPPLAAKTLETT